MLEADLIAHAAPTLAGLKTGSLISCACARYETLRREICSVNRQISGKGLRLIPLRVRNERALLYLYRPAQLARDLSHSAAAALLLEEGYTDMRQGLCLRELKRRLASEDGFPHEIGLFLSYPPEDVRGFIEHGGRNCKCCGYWKVYGDVQRAQAQFCAYRKCTDCYRRCRQLGVSFERLAVAV